MLKIFSTQLTGYFQRIMTSEDINIEDGARILAQTILHKGTIYIRGINEMASIELEALQGAEPLRQARLLTNVDDVNAMDAVLLVSRYATDEEIVHLAKQLREKNIPLIGISTIKEGGQTLLSYTDVHIDTKLTRSLLPADDGSRFGYPSIMTALFAYYGLAFTTKEILEDYED